MSNAGAIALVKAGVLNVLIELFLSGTKVSDEGATSIADGLVNPQCTLQTLSLSGANIGDVGGRAFAMVLPQILWNCHLCTEVAKVL